MRVENFFQPDIVPIQKVQYGGLIFDVLRMDKIHSGTSGNKFFKLKYNFIEAEKKGHKKILTFGGAFSNHIHATAIAAKACEFEAIGVIRGDEMQNNTLNEAAQNGMHLHFVDRGKYKEKNKPSFQKSLKDLFGDVFIIPEGGTNAKAIKGTKEIMDLIPSQYDLICAPFGTGGTLAGIINAKKDHQHVWGFSALKGEWAKEKLEELTSHQNGWQLHTDYHFGGYAKWKPELVEFIEDFYEKTAIPLDPVYTGKMLYGVLMEWKKGNISPEQNVLAIHTGGLQGISGFNNRFGFDLPAS